MDELDRQLDRIITQSRLNPEASVSYYRGRIKAQLAKCKRTLCSNCDTPLLKEGEAYQNIRRETVDEIRAIMRNANDLRDLERQLADWLGEQRQNETRASSKR